MRILIAEDETTTRMVLRGMLESWGHQVIAVADGQEAIDVLQGESPPSLAILDWMMPHMNGVEVCKRVRLENNLKPIHLILLTGRDATEDVVAGLEAGADDYVTKPFNDSELRARISVAERITELQGSLNAHIKRLEEALAHVKTLQGILPVCMHCHKIRTDDQAWEKLESYLEDHTDVQISHGLCPECLKERYPEVWDEDQMEEMNSPSAAP